MPRWTRTFCSAATLKSPSLLPDGQFRFTVESEPGHRYRTETSPDLAAWEAISTNTVSLPGGMTVSHQVPGGSPQRFFRCVIVP
jgi:hypothetical protein